MADNENTHSKRGPEGRAEMPLHEAAARGDRRGVETLLASGADIHARNARGATALHRSALRGNQETTRTLIEAGAQVNARTHQGDTPLHLAAWSGNHENIAALARAGADRSARNHNGERPIEVAIARDHKDAMRQGFKAAETDKKMGLIDWVTKDRPAPQQQPVARTSQEQKQGAPAPTNAKEFYAQKAEQDKAALKQIGPDLEERAKEIGKVMDKTTEHLRERSPAPPAPDSGSNAALLQKGENQGKTQAALSPTDHVKGQSALQSVRAEQAPTEAAPPKQPTPTRGGWSRGR